MASITGRCVRRSRGPGRARAAWSSVTPTATVSGATSPAANTAHCPAKVQARIASADSGSISCCAMPRLKWRECSSPHSQQEGRRRAR